jgi:hypothetical protein
MVPWNGWSIVAMVELGMVESVPDIGIRTTHSRESSRASHHESGRLIPASLDRGDVRFVSGLSMDWAGLAHGLD